MRQVTISIVAFVFAAFVSSCGGSAGGDPSLMTTRSLSSPDTARATGKVLDASGSPIADVRITATTAVDTLEDQPFARRTATTDTSGAYTLDGLLCRGYTMEFSAPQYFTRSISKSLPSEAKGKTSLWGELKLLPVPTPGYYMATGDIPGILRQMVSGRLSDAATSQAMSLTSVPLPKVALEKDEQGGWTLMQLFQSVDAMRLPEFSSLNGFIVGVGSGSDALVASPLKEVRKSEEMSIFIYQELFSQGENIKDSEVVTKSCSFTLGRPLFFPKDGEVSGLANGVYAISSVELSRQHVVCLIRVRG